MMGTPPKPAASGGLLPPPSRGRWHRRQAVTEGGRLSASADQSMPPSVSLTLDSSPAKGGAMRDAPPYRRTSRQSLRPMR